MIEMEKKNKRELHHVCLVSDQLLANVIPIYAKLPNIVHLIVTVDKRNVAKRFAELLNSRGLKTISHYDAPAMSIAEIYRYALKVTNEIRQDFPDAELVLNATGGTKPMAMAFSAVFQSELTSDVLYTNTENSTLEYIFPMSKKAEKIPGVLNVEVYLNAQNIKIEYSECELEGRQDAIYQREKITRFLVEKVGKNGIIFGILNGMVSSALHKVNGLEESTQMFGKKMSNKPWVEILNALQNADLIEWDGIKSLTFQSEEAAKYICGGWLEEYAWLIAVESELDDYKLGANVKTTSRTGARVPNEYDLVAVNNNRLLLVECKTVNYEKNSSGMGQDISYKLDSLGRNAGGLWGRTLLLSAWKLPTHNVERARANGIDILSGNQISQLKSYIRNWAAQ